MRSTRAEQLAVVMKALQWGWSEGVASSGLEKRTTGNGRIRLEQAKPFCMTKRQVWEAYKRVKANKGAAGVDGQSLEAFEQDLEGNLY